MRSPCCRSAGRTCRGLPAAQRRQVWRLPRRGLGAQVRSRPHNRNCSATRLPRVGCRSWGRACPRHARWVPRHEFRVQPRIWLTHAAKRQSARGSRVLPAPTWREQRPRVRHAVFRPPARHARLAWRGTGREERRWCAGPRQARWFSVSASAQRGALSSAVSLPRAIDVWA